MTGLSSTKDSRFSTPLTEQHQRMNHNDPLIEQMRGMARDGSKVSQILRFLVIDQGIEDQVRLMELFRDAFKTSLGSVTAIGAWWHEGERELDDEAIDSYINYVINDYLALH